MTFFESLKKWFYTKNSSAASSDARVPLLDASGNPKGSDTMANLASVLGAYYIYPALTSAADFNDYTHTGVVLVYTMSINAGIQNAPTGIAYGYLEILLINKTNERIRQRYYIWGNKSFMAYRYYENGSWSTWRYD